MAVEIMTCYTTVVYDINLRVVFCTGVQIPNKKDCVKKTIQYLFHRGYSLRLSSFYVSHHVASISICLSEA